MYPDLLDRAQQDASHLIPVVFNLASWAEQRGALADWLMDELYKRYDVPRKLAKAWVDAEIILPLLDGLDEVAADHREACVEAINAYLHAHGLVPLVVCSRRADYAALTVRLRVPSAVLIQALSQQQVQSYVDHAGAALVGLRTALQHDESLWELLNTPLMLSIAAFAYQGRSADEIPATGTGEAHRVQLFAAYTDAMFHRRARTTPYTREQTEHWLMWLARAMKDHDQSIFYVEVMQPNWVTEPRQQKIQQHILSVIVIMLFGPPLGMPLVLDVGVPLWVFGMVPVVLVLKWLLHKYTPVGRRWARWIESRPFYATTQEIKPIETIQWSWSGLLTGLFTIGEIPRRSFPNEGIKRSMQNGLISGLFFGLMSGLSPGLMGGLLSGLMSGLLVGLAVGLRYGGQASLHHFALRLVLWHNNFAPLNYIGFLDYAAARIFLRKVGGGYVFIHRMLLEYFAARYQISAEQQK